MNKLTESMVQITDLEKLSLISEQFLQLSDKDLDYQQIADDLLDISGAKYVIFNLYELQGGDYSTVAMSGNGLMIKKASDLLGFTFVGKIRQQNPAIIEKIKKNTITRFSSLKELAGEAVPKTILRQVEKIFNVGECFFVKIIKNDTLIGDFQLIMENNHEFQKAAIVEIYSRQVGLLIMRRKIEEALIENEQRYKFLFEDSGVAIGYYKPDGTVVFYNKRAAENMGGRPSEYQGKSIYDLFPKAAADFYMGRINEALLRDEAQEYTDYVVLEPGSKWFSSVFKRVMDIHGNVAGVQIISKDITEIKNTEDALRKSEEKYRLLAETASDVIWVLNISKDKYTYISPSIFYLRGLSVEEAMEEKLEDSLTPESFEKVKAIMARSVSKFLNNPKDHESSVTEIQQPCKNGEMIWVEVSTKLRFGPEGDLEVVGLSRNIEDRKKTEQEVVYLSYHDHLTGLYNRRFYEEELRRLDTPRNLPIALIMADLNGLKLTNDAFGHKMGDELLVNIAKAIKKECRADEIVARIGGDEFMVLLPRTTAGEAKKLIERISNSIEKEKNDLFVLSISMGFAFKSEQSEQMDEVFKRAEDDMYRHKLSESSSMRSKTIDLIMNSLFEKNNRELHHSKRVSEICEAIASKMDFAKVEISQIKTAGLMHDIGKIGIGNHILNKEGKLTHDEWQEIKRHSEVGYRILCSSNEFSEIADYVLEHQERWDGKGYPKGLKGEEIAIEARIVAIADAYDAMTSDRSYRKGLCEKEAILEIERCAGQQFDPNIAKIFIEQVLKKA